MLPVVSAPSLVLVAGMAFASLGCTRGASNPANDGGGCPPNIPCDCDCPSGYDGGVCVCQNASEAVCPVTAQESQPCAGYGGMGCMGCYQGAGFTCSCIDAGTPLLDGGGPSWQCVGTEYACTGGTF